MTNTSTRSFASSFIFVMLISCLAYSQNTISNTIRVKVKENHVAKFEKSSAQNLRTKFGYIQSGVAAVDRVHEELGAVEFKRVFSDGGKFEKRRRKFGLHLWYEVTFDPSKSNTLQNQLKSYSRLEEVAFTEPVYEKQLPTIPGQPFSIKKIDNSNLQEFQSNATNDPRLVDQWHYHNDGQTSGLIDADIDLPEAWSLQKGSDQVIVAIIDGGIDVHHEDLSGNIWVNDLELNGTPGIDDDGNGYIDDIHGYNLADNQGTIIAGNHGTHVAGTVAAVSNNGVGVAGVAGGSGSSDGVRLMSCQVFGNNTDGFAEAFAYAADNGAIISQNSWGYTAAGYYEQAVLDGIDYFIANAGFDENDDPIGPMQGGIVIFAAGNDNSNAAHYPGYYEPVLAVASTNHNDQKAWYSNFGTWVDISAPGGETSITNQGVLSTLPSNSYGYYQGTSMACPHVSGVAALIVSEFGTGALIPGQVRARLLESADAIADLNPSYAGLLGSGRLNAAASLLTDEGIAPDPISSLTISQVGFDEITLEWIAPSDEDNESASSYEIRYSTSEITAENFGSAEWGGVLIASSNGTAETFVIDGLASSTVYYVAIKSFDFFGNESLISNVANASTVEPPIINVDPLSLSSSLLTGETDSQIITVSNTGSADLNVNINLQYTTAETVSIDQSTLLLGENNRGNTVTNELSQITPLAVGDFVDLAPSPALLTCLTIDPTTGYIYGQKNGGYEYYKYVPSTNNWEQLTSSEINSGNNGGAAYLDGKIYNFYTSNSAVINVYNISEDTWTTIVNGFGSTGNVTTDGEFIYVVKNNTFKKYDPELNEWTTLGSPSISFNSWGGLEFYNNHIYGHTGDGSSGFQRYSVAENTWEILPSIPGGAVLGSALDSKKGVYYAYGSYSGNNFYSYSIDDNVWSVAILEGFTVSDGGLVYSDRVGLEGIYFSAGEAGYGFRKFELESLAWLEFEEEEVVIESGNSYELPVVFNAYQMFGGTYTAELEFTSNDPETSSLIVALDMTVTGVQDIEISSDNIDFGELFLGETKKDSVLIKNVGTDDLTISAIENTNSAFTLSSIAEVLSPGESEYLVIEFISEEVGLYEDVITITSDDHDESELYINVSGIGVEPPIAEVSPMSITSDLFSGDSQTYFISLTNNGGSQLNYEIVDETMTVTESSTSEAQVVFVPKKGEMDTAAGDPVLSGKGDDGDGFGYHWIDSTEPNGPSFDWIEISDIGEPLSLGDDNFATVSIPFGFEFYGEIKNQVYISSNGFITFNSSGARSYSHPGIPYTGFPNDMIAPLHADLISGANTIYYLAESDRFIVQYQGISYLGGSDEFTFQIILFQSGQIKIQYLAMDIEPSYYLLGIENSTGTDGIQIARNTSYITNELAILISTEQLISDIYPVAGQVGVGETQEIAVTLSATGLFGGTYETSFNISTNDPLNPTVNIPITMNVTGVPQLELSSDNIDFGELFLGETKKDSVLIKNWGTDDLTISAIENTNSAFTLSSIAEVLSPGESEYLVIEFISEEVSLYEDVITITSDDHDEPELYINVSGIGVEPPIAEVSPLSITSDLFSGDSQTYYISLTNNGGSQLNYEIVDETMTVTESSTSEAQVVFVPKKGEMDTATGDPVLSGKGNDGDGFGYQWIDSTEPNGPSFDWIEISDIGEPLSLGDDNYATVSIPFGFEYYGEIKNQVYISSNGFITFNSSGASSYSHPGIPYTGFPNDMIAPLHADLISGANTIYYLAESDRFIVQYQGISYLGGSDEFTFQIILYQNGNIKIQYLAMDVEPSYYLLGIENSTGTDGIQIARNTSYITNELAILISTEQLISDISPVAGQVGVGETQEIAVMLSADGLYEGIYETAFNISTNDPLNPIFNIPITMNVTGVAQLGLSKSVVEFGQVYSGYSKNDSILVSNVGTSDLEISSIISQNESFDFIMEDRVLGLGESEYLKIEFNPEASGAYEGVIIISSNDHDEEEIYIDLKGNSIEAPRAVISPDSISLSLNKNVESTRKLRIDNKGGSMLDGHLSLNWLSTSSKSKTLNSRDIGYFADQTRSSSSTTMLGFSNGNTPESDALGDIEIIDSYFPDENSGMIYLNGYLYVVLYYQSVLVKYDVENKTVSAQYPIHQYAYGITYDGNYLWIADDSGNIYGYDLNGNSIGSFSSPINNFISLTYNGENFVVSQAFNASSFTYVMTHSGEIVTQMSFPYGYQEMSYVKAHEVLNGAGYWGIEYETGKLHNFKFDDSGIQIINEIDISTGTLFYSITHDSESILLANWFGDLYSLDDGIDEFAWLKIEESSVRLSPNSYQEIELSFDSRFNEAGTYRAQVVFESNDPQNSSIQIPVTMEILLSDSEYCPQMISNPISEPLLITEYEYLYNLNNYFQDPNNDALEFTVYSNGNIVESEIIGTILALRPKNVGSESLTIYVDDNNCDLKEFTFTVTVNPLTEVISENKPLSDRIAIFPNPFSGETTISYEIQNNSNELVNISIVGIDGKEISVLVDASMSAGKYSIGFDSKGLRAGVYLCKLTINGATHVKRMIVK